MQKVDIAIAIVGAVALLATGLGVAFYDDGLTDYTVQSRTQDYSGNALIPQGGADIELDVPDNVYHTVMDVTVSFSSQNPAASGTVNVLVRVTAPDGTTMGETSCSAQFSAGSCTATLDGMDKWGDAPSDFRGDADDLEANTLTWDQPLLLEIDVQYPSTPLDNLAPPTFSAAYEGAWHGYSILGDLPDVESA